MAESKDLNLMVAKVKMFFKKQNAYLGFLYQN